MRANPGSIAVVEIIPHSKGNVVARTQVGDLFRKQRCGRTENDFSAAFVDGALAMPLSQDATGCKGGEISGVSQLFIANVEFNTLGRALAQTLRQSDQD